MTTGKKLERVQVASALYDFIAAGVYVLPVVAMWYLNSTLHSAHQTWGTSGDFPAFDHLHVIFVNLFGGFVVMWSTLRIIKRTPVFALCDGLLRFYFAIIMLFYVLNWQVTSLIYAFILMEIFWGYWQLSLYYALQKQGKLQSILIRET